MQDDASSCVTQIMNFSPGPYGHVGRRALVYTYRHVMRVICVMSRYVLLLLLSLSLLLPVYTIACLYFVLLDGVSEYLEVISKEKA